MFAPLVLLPGWIMCEVGVLLIGSPVGGKPGLLRKSELLVYLCDIGAAY